MKKIIYLVISLIFGSLNMNHALANNSQHQESFFDYAAVDILGNSVNLSQYKGKVILAVNTASNCGFTGQYQDLQKLYEKYKEQGFIVLAFPSNDFGGQEPGSNEEIKTFCENKYSVTFPIFSKAPVSGTDIQPAYKFLTQKSDKQFQGDPGWNFVKFLVNKEGQVVARFSSMTNPMSKKVLGKIEELL